MGTEHHKIAWMAMTIWMEKMGVIVSQAKLGMTILSVRTRSADGEEGMS